VLTSKKRNQKITNLKALMTLKMLMRNPLINGMHSQHLNNNKRRTYQINRTKKMIMMMVLGTLTTKIRVKLMKLRREAVGMHLDNRNKTLKMMVLVKDSKNSKGQIIIKRKTNLKTSKLVLKRNHLQLKLLK
jgi:hypothetical protein